MRPISSLPTWPTVTEVSPRASACSTSMADSSGRKLYQRNTLSPITPISTRPMAPVTADWRMKAVAWTVSVVSSKLTSAPTVLALMSEMGMLVTL